MNITEYNVVLNKNNKQKCWSLLAQHNLSRYLEPVYLSSLEILTLTCEMRIEFTWVHELPLSDIWIVYEVEILKSLVKNSCSGACGLPPNIK